MKRRSADRAARDRTMDGAQVLPSQRRYWLADARIPVGATPRCLPRHRTGGARENGLMGITNGIIQGRAIANLQLNMRRMLEAQPVASRLTMEPALAGIAS